MLKNVLLSKRPSFLDLLKILKIKYSKNVPTMTVTVTQQSTLQFQKSYQDPLDTLTLHSPDRVSKSCQI